MVRLGREGGESKERIFTRCVFDGIHRNLQFELLMQSRQMASSQTRRSDCRKPVQTNLDLHNFCPLKFHFLFLFHVSYTNCNTNTQNMILWSDLSHTLWRREARVCNSCSCRPDQLSADHFHFLLLFHFSYTNCKRYTRNLIPWFDLSHTLFRREARVCNSCSQLQTRPALCRPVHNLGMLHLVFRISGSIETALSV